MRDWERGMQTDRRTFLSLACLPLSFHLQPISCHWEHLSHTLIRSGSHDLRDVPFLPDSRSQPHTHTHTHSLSLTLSEDSCCSCLRHRGSHTLIQPHIPTHISSQTSTSESAKSLSRQVVGVCINERSCSFINSRSLSLTPLIYRQH